MKILSSLLFVSFVSLKGQNETNTSFPESADVVRMISDYLTIDDKLYGVNRMISNIAYKSISAEDWVDKLEVLADSEFSRESDRDFVDWFESTWNKFESKTKVQIKEIIKQRNLTNTTMPFIRITTPNLVQWSFVFDLFPDAPFNNPQFFSKDCFIYPDSSVLQIVFKNTKDLINRIIADKGFYNALPHIIKRIEPSIKGIIRFGSGGIDGVTAKNPELFTDFLKFWFRTTKLKFVYQGHPEGEVPWRYIQDPALKRVIQMNSKRYRVY